MLALIPFPFLLLVIITCYRYLRRKKKEKKAEQEEIISPAVVIQGKLTGIISNKLLGF